MKLASTIDDGDVRHLHWLKERLGEDLIDAVVISTGAHAYRRGDGIGVVPAALLLRSALGGEALIDGRVGSWLLNTALLGAGGASPPSLQHRFLSTKLHLSSHAS